MKKVITYPEFELKAFKLQNAKNLEYHFLKPTNNNSELSQTLVIYLKRTGKDKVVSAISKLNKLDFIKRGLPDYNYRTQFD